MKLLINKHKDPATNNIVLMSTEYFNETENGSSDERLGKYHAYAYNLTLAKKFTDLLSASVQYGHQTQSFGLKMDWVALGFNYSF